MSRPARLVLVDPDRRVGRHVQTICAPLSDAMLGQLGVIGRHPVHQWAADSQRLRPLLAAFLWEPHWRIRVCCDERAGLMVVVEPRADQAAPPDFRPETAAALQTALQTALRSAPAAEAPARLAKPPSISSIVLVDDDAMVRAVCRRMLQERYLVLEAAGSAEALTLADWLPWPPDLLVSDVNLPDTDGVALAEEWLGRWPAGRVLLLSGSFIPEKANHLGVPFLQKPFQADELVRCIEMLLGPRIAPKQPV